MSDLTNRGFQREFKFRTSRSSGKGGQHVNKVATRVELIYNVSESKILSDEERTLINEKLGHRISLTGELRIVVDMTRSQLKNKEISVERFYKLIEKALKKPKLRKPVKRTKASIEKRHQAKLNVSEKKKNRRKVDLRRTEE